MEYRFSDIEKEVKVFWKQKNVYRVENDASLPKYYVLDMFPYPSGAGLHVGHPLGYIASDIVARYKRLKGFNVLHPMGFDSFGLPAEQYAIQTGQHPAITTDENIKTFKEQLDKIGFSFDWSRELRTSDPGFYKWTQWIFIRLFHSWYNTKTDKAEPIAALVLEFGLNGNKNVEAASDEIKIFSADEWKNFSVKEKSDVLLNYRLAYIADSWVNWCAALGTVLANDEVKDGVSERGGYPVERKLMKQWSLRITAYAERLLNGLNDIDWSDSIKEAQRNWIGKSEGCSVKFTIDHSPLTIEVFTTRPDTIFGVSLITLAPEHELVNQITTTENAKAVDEYVTYAKNRSERDRMTDIKKITGQFTGAYAIHPFSKKQIPIWIGEYVLATYGTGAVMGVPGHDERDWRFATHFGLDKISILEDVDVSEKSFDEKEGVLCNSDFLNGLKVKDAIAKASSEIEKQNIGKRKINYKLRDAIFGRQRYWGEPIPIYYEDGIPQTVDEKDLPIKLPEVKKYLPTETGEPPLANAVDWKYKNKFEFEKTTMPGWAGSSWYYLRYGDPTNDKAFASHESINYWKNVDLYVGGDEHATGHLIYFRFWTKFLFDLGLIPFDEPAKKLVNQGKIGAATYEILMASDNSVNEVSVVKGSMSKGVTSLKYGSKNEITFSSPVKNFFFSVDAHPGVIGMSLLNPVYAYLDSIEQTHQDSENNTSILNLKKFSEYHENDNSVFVTKNGFYHESNFFPFNEGQSPDNFFVKFLAVEKMSKSKLNVINPNDVAEKYGADTFRMYEMFLGPIEQHKPWDTKGIDGVFRFLKKFCKLFYDDGELLLVNDDAPTTDELKILHRTIKKIEDDVEKLSFNTSVSAFMICVNELTALNTHKKKILEPLLITLAPFAPFIAEYLWQKLGHKESIVKASFPKYDASLLEETSFEYPVAVNGKTRAKMNFALDIPIEQIEKEVITAEALQKYFEGKPPKKVIVVKGKMINVVV